MTALVLSSADRILTPPTSAFTAVSFGDVNIETDGVNPHPVATSAHGWPAIPRDTGVTDVDGLTSDGSFAPAGDHALFLALEGGDALDYDWIVNGMGMSLVLASDTVAQAKVGDQTLSTGPLTTPFGAGVSVVALRATTTDTEFLTSQDGSFATGGPAAALSPALFLSDATAGDVNFLGMWLFEDTTVSTTDAIDTMAAIVAQFEEEAPTTEGSTIGASYVSALAQSIIGPLHSPLFPEVLWGAWMDDSNTVIEMTGVRVLHEEFGPGLNSATNITDVDAGAMPATTPTRFGIFDAASGGDLVVYAEVTWPDPLPAEGDPVRFPPGALVIVATPEGS